MPMVCSINVALPHPWARPPESGNAKTTSKVSPAATAWLRTRCQLDDCLWEMPRSASVVFLSGASIVAEPEELGPLKLPGVPFAFSISASSALALRSARNEGE